MFGSRLFRATVPAGRSALCRSPACREESEELELSHPTNAAESNKRPTAINIFNIIQLLAQKYEMG